MANTTELQPKSYEAPPQEEKSPVRILAEQLDESFMAGELTWQEAENFFLGNTVVIKDKHGNGAIGLASNQQNTPPKA